MPSTRRLRLLRLSIATGIGVIILSAAAGAFVDTRPEVARANEWAVSSAALGTLPVTLDAFVAYPTEYRKAAYRVMTPVQKSALWTEHIDRFMVDPRLNDEQRAFVSRARALLSPAVYDRESPNNAALRAEFKALCQNGPKLFGPDLRRWLSDLAPNAEHMPESRMVVAFRYLASLTAVLRADNAADCRCNPESWCDECEGGEVCKDLPCTITYDECGCLGTSDCTKKCESPVMN